MCMPFVGPIRREIERRTTLNQWSLKSQSIGVDYMTPFYVLNSVDAIMENLSPMELQPLRSIMVYLPLVLLEIERRNRAKFWHFSKFWKNWKKLGMEDTIH